MSGSTRRAGARRFRSMNSFGLAAPSWTHEKPEGLGGTAPAALVLPGLADGDVVPQTAPLAPVPLNATTPSPADVLDPSYWDLGTIGKGLLKGIAGLDTRKAERADIETVKRLCMNQGIKNKLILSSTK